MSISTDRCFHCNKAIYEYEIEIQKTPIFLHKNSECKAHQFCGGEYFLEKIENIKSEKLKNTILFSCPICAEILETSDLEKSINLKVNMIISLTLAGM